MTEITYRQDMASRDCLISYFSDMYVRGEIHAITVFPPYVDKLMENASVFEAWQGNRLVGFCAVYCNRPERDFAFIPQINVLPVLRGRGVARNLVREIVSHTTRLGFMVLRLYANKTNLRSVAFYKKMGFNDVTESEHQILFERPLGVDYD